MTKTYYLFHHGTLTGSFSCQFARTPLSSQEQGVNHILIYITQMTSDKIGEDLVGVMHGFSAAYCSHYHALIFLDVSEP